MDKTILTREFPTNADAKNWLMTLRFCGVNINGTKFAATAAEVTAVDVAKENDETQVVVTLHASGSKIKDES